MELKIASLHQAKTLTHKGISYLLNKKLYLNKSNLGVKN